MGLATSNRKASPSLSELVTQYASTLAAQGRLATAMEYLDLVRRLAGPPAGCSTCLKRRGLQQQALRAQLATLRCPVHAAHPQHLA
jgi:hypothetical protein